MAYRSIEKDGYILYQNEGGAEIGSASGKVIEKDGLVFRNLAGSGQLLPYEDWRLSSEERAQDLTERLSAQEMIGLTLHSSAQPVPALPGMMENAGTYGGKPFKDSDAAPWELTDQQKKMLDSGMRHFLVSKTESVEAAVRWSNNIQKEAENLPYGIPVNLSSDPRHGADTEAAEFHAEASGVSQWPEGLAMASVADPSVCRAFARAVAREYRALGITTALSPQIDLASDPRWFRIRDTFGSDVELDIALAQSFCDGLQTTEDSSTGWGKESVLAMAKHWPGGGTGEGGRDAHYPFGKYAVFPGNNLSEHLRPFTEGAMKLPGKTKSCAAIMPYYTISWEQDFKNHENVGNSYNEYLIRDLLIGQYGFKGVICTDWGVVRDMTPHVGMYVRGGKCHGVEKLPVEERILKLMYNGVNQFGGLDEREKVDLAYKIGCERYGTEFMDQLLHTSAFKLLLNLFRLGLFDNPYLDLEKSKAAIGCRELVALGLNAQQRSPVLLKNKGGVLPLEAALKIYVPKRHVDPHYNFVRMKTATAEIDPLPNILLHGRFTRVDTPECADAALIFIDSPRGRNGYEFDMMDRGQQPETGYYPISLQYRPYTAELARDVSLAGGDPRETGTNRTYKGRTEQTANEKDLDLVLEARKQMGTKPVIVVVRMDKPAVLKELEPYADAILADFGVSKKVILDLLAGTISPQGKLPVILPADMETVETHCEDLVTDIRPYTDSEGNTYTLGFGLHYWR
ncbi:MAG: glycoside hydrolase family 3 C-terminal domain-containing protein [Lachnospiraceae bacterium]|nr:glycoside hydrolase family 3 C-terminal domain-containing protein [Lachnospiraceae bacterium]